MEKGGEVVVWKDFKCDLRWCCDGSVLCCRCFWCGLMYRQQAYESGDRVNDQFLRAAITRI